MFTIIIIAAASGTFLLLIIVIPVSVVLWKRCRKDEVVIRPLPTPDDEIFHPVWNSNRQYQPEISDDENIQSDGSVLMPAGSNFTSGRSPRFERLNDIQSTTPNCRSEHVTGRNENGSSGRNETRSPGRNETRSPGDDGDSSSDDSDYVNTSPDYMNNPVSIARAAAEAEQRLQQRRNGPNPSLAQSQGVTGSNRQAAAAAAAARQVHTMGAVTATSGCPGMATGAKWGSQDVRLAAAACEHSPSPKTKRGYVNTSISLENLEKRSVPQPPPLLSNPGTKANKLSIPVPLPKPHKGKVQGYVNIPMY